ncbi:adenylosuccinate lyase [Hydrogenivirga caldilitoris]|uniref:Adenylosuccinate lyase n=1 Tax=Hydrogenivirga caldilitoris TaxID=246264 RepID=A0A497XT62_9AQUI|nr:adenylosuccinate lyase [Hydrogenivirga caldilitoris]RLJ71360.1 adenylosuccinate lyase [Hydrogenivirga caldilitoris]
MIERYTRKEIGEIWSERNKFQKWLEVEIAVCRAWAKLGKIPKEALKKIEDKTRIDEETLQKIREYERVYKHDVLAFVSAISEQVGEEGRFIHLGLTSSDVIDTALALLMREALDVLLKDIELVMEELKRLAYEHKDTLMIGRTHGVHAEPTTFGIKMAVWYDEMRRNRERLLMAKERVSYGKISGAVGTYSNVPPEVERFALEELGLKAEPASTQIVHRDRHAELISAIAITASSLDKFATEIRHLQRTEVLEAQEPFTEGQRGSSAMPHKKNPIHSERICGLARVIRSNLITALENVVLWHERDISHSSAERVILPDSTIALDYILNLFYEILQGLVVDRERMLKNMELSKGLYFSSKVLVALTEKGLARDKAYDLVQRAAMKSWNSDKSFKEALMEEPEVNKLLSKEEMERLFDLWEFVKHRDYIFKKVFG